jgi:hypothetical protein
MFSLASLRSDGWTTCPELVDDFIGIRTWVQIPFDYYFKTYENLYLIQVEKHGIPVDMFDSGILEPKMTDGDIPRLVSLVKEHNRVWLVYSHNWYTDPMGLIPQTLASKMELIRQRDFYGGQVQLYETP